VRQDANVQYVVLYVLTDKRAIVSYAELVKMTHNSVNGQMEAISLESL
jgi:hypothetical protein